MERYKREVKEANSKFETELYDLFDRGLSHTNEDYLSLTNNLLRAIKDIQKT